MLTKTQKKQIKQAEKEIKLRNNAIVWFLEIIPLLRVTKTIIEEQDHSVWVRRMYWLFCFIPLFSTERCYEPDRELCKQKYDFGFPNF